MRVALMLALTIVLVPAVRAQASCAGPGLAAPAEVMPGEIVTVRGEDFSDGECDDTGPDGGGFCTAAPEPARPRMDLPITFVQGERIWHLTIVDAGPDYGFEVEVRVPRGARPGVANFGAPGAGAEVRVTKPDR